MVLDFGARAQDFLKRITPLSADLAAHGRTRTLALQKLHRLCQAEVRRLKARYTLATVKLALSKYRERDPRDVDRITWSWAKGKCAPANASAISPSNQKKPARWNVAYHERIHLRPIQSHPVRDRRLSSKRLLNSWPATATSKKMGLA